jgi:hypothetical protein
MSVEADAREDDACELCVVVLFCLVRCGLPFSFVRLSPLGDCICLGSDPVVACVELGLRILDKLLVELPVGTGICAASGCCGSSSDGV